jgi:hypothetical protein
MSWFNKEKLSSYKIETIRILVIEQENEIKNLKKQKRDLKKELVSLEERLASTISDILKNKREVALFIQDNITASNNYKSEMMNIIDKFIINYNIRPNKQLIIHFISDLEQYINKSHIQLIIDILFNQINALTINNKK